MCEELYGWKDNPKTRQKQKEESKSGWSVPLAGPPSRPCCGSGIGACMQCCTLRIPRCCGAGEGEAGVSRAEGKRVREGGLVERELHGEREGKSQRRESGTPAFLGMGVRTFTAAELMGNGHSGEHG